MLLQATWPPQEGLSCQTRSSQSAATQQTTYNFYINIGHWRKPLMFVFSYPRGSRNKIDSLMFLFVLWWTWSASCLVPVEVPIIVRFSDFRLRKLLGGKRGWGGVHLHFIYESSCLMFRVRFFLFNSSGSSVMFTAITGGRDTETVNMSLCELH